MVPRAVCLVVLLSVAVGGCAPARSSRPETHDLDSAVVIALGELDRQPAAPSGYQLVGAQQFVVKGRWIWRITFKPLHLLPADPSRGKIGAGGEIFVNVDLQTGGATVRWGESSDCRDHRTGRTCYREEARGDRPTTPAAVDRGNRRTAGAPGGKTDIETPG